MPASPINGHDPQPGTWHPHDVAAAWLYPGTDTAGTDTGDHGEAGTGGDGAPGWGEEWRDLHDVPLTEPPPALHGVIAPGPVVTLLYGRPGAGKGYAAAYLASQVLSDGGKVLIVDAEGYPAEWRRRITMMSGGLEPGNVAIRGHLGGALKVDDYSGLADLLIVDSAGHFAVEDGHDPWRESALSMRAAAHLAGIPTLVIGHPSKGSTAMYGSVYWQAACRAAWEVDRQRLVCTKANDVGGLQEGDIHAVHYEADLVGNCLSYRLGHEPIRKETDIMREVMGDDEYSITVLATALAWSESKVRKVLQSMGATYREVPTGGGPKRLWRVA